MASGNTYDAIVVGSGPNGLVAANRLLDAGWSVLVVEEQQVAGGAVRSGELIEPGFTNDQFSSFYPLAAASPAIKSMGLADYGLEWCRGDVAVAHPRADGTASIIARELDRTVENLESFAAGDGAQWRKSYATWNKLSDDLLGSLFTMFPPIKPLLGIAAKGSPAELIDLLRLSLAGASTQGEHWFNGDGGQRMLSGNALHADLAPDKMPSAVYGWVLMSLAQEVGFPVPRGGAGRLAAAMVDRFKDHGGELLLGSRATRLRTIKGRVRVVEWEGGSAGARKAVLADVGAPQLYGELLDEADVPHRVRSALKKFEYDDATVKIDWTLDGPIPWTAEAVRESGTVHVAEGNHALIAQSSEIAQGLIPHTPYLVMGQYSMLDPTRSPEGKDTAWAYTHVPQLIKGDARGEITGAWDEGDRQHMIDRVEDEVEKLAPGFKDLIRGRHAMMPPDFPAFDRNLVNGSVNGGTSELSQQLFLRPIPGLGRPETPLPGLYLASASAHPGGGVHGAAGANAAEAAIGADERRVRTLVAGALARKLQGG
jgi:phytoene dehydrogenase-like protein